MSTTAITKFAVSVVVPFCGESIKATAKKCKHCGDFFESKPFAPSQPSQFIDFRPSSQPTPDMVVQSGHNPVLMALLSGLCLAGLGQMIISQVLKGFVILIGGMIFAAITGFLAAPVVWAFAGIDAYMIAKKRQRGQAVGKWEFF